MLTNPPSGEPARLIDAAQAFADSMVSEADGSVAGYVPWWHGWALRDAYLAGHAAATDELRQLRAENERWNEILQDEMAETLELLALLGITKEHLEATGESSMALVKQELTRLQRVEAAALSYVDIRSNHPQIAGEAWRDLCAALAERPAAEKGPTP